MTTKPRFLSNGLYQLLLMGLLGSSGIVFLPILIRTIDSAVMAQIMVAQVYVYYLSQLTQYGFTWSGPANFAKAATVAAQYRIWRLSIVSKRLLLLGPVTALAAWLYSIQTEHADYLLCFALLLIAYALHSNWYLQAQDDFVSGVWLVAIGILCSLGLLYYVQSLAYPNSEWTAASVIMILTLPQIVLGIGSYCRIHYQSKLQTTTIRLTEISQTLRQDTPLVLGQLLVLAATTLGTPVVASLASAEITTAYAATEKLFNLGATVLVGLYMSDYPSLARRFHHSRQQYWSRIRQGCYYLFGFGIVLLIGLQTMGQDLQSLYLSAALAKPIQPVLLAFGIWLILCLSQHLINGYLVFRQQAMTSLVIHGAVLAITCISGYGFAQINPLYWVYGMIAGQVLPCLLLLMYYWQDHRRL